MRFIIKWLRIEHKFFAFIHTIHPLPFEHKLLLLTHKHSSDPVNGEAVQSWIVRYLWPVTHVFQLKIQLAKGQVCLFSHNVSPEIKEP